MFKTTFVYCFFYFPQPPVPQPEELVDDPTEGRGPEEEDREDREDCDPMKDENPDPKFRGQEEKLPGVCVAGRGLQGLARGLLEPSLNINIIRAVNTETQKYREI